MSQRPSWPCSYLFSRVVWSVVHSADGNFTVKQQTKVTIHDDGLIVWKPPAIYKSLCPIDVEFFPFDEQTCTIKIGSWTYDGFSVNILHKMLPDGVNHLSVIEKGIDCQQQETQLSQTQRATVRQTDHIGLSYFMSSSVVTMSPSCTVFEISVLVYSYNMMMIIIIPGHCLWCCHHAVAALREFTLVHTVSAARRQVAADLWTKPIGLNHT